jgi:predicted N-acetyltransferase YhbS
MHASIRPARQSDAGDIARLTRHLGYDASEDDVSARLSRILARPEQVFVVAELDGRTVGWVHVQIAECVDVEAFVLIAGLVVDAGVRKQGVGRLLMHHAEEWARTRGVRMVRLSSSATRHEAHRFYERIGYTNLKTQYAFAKLLDGGGAERLKHLVPRVSGPQGPEVDG